MGVFRVAFLFFVCFFSVRRRLIFDFGSFWFFCLKRQQRTSAAPSASASAPICSTSSAPSWPPSSTFGAWSPALATPPPALATSPASAPSLPDVWTHRRFGFHSYFSIFFSYFFAQFFPDFPRPPPLFAILVSPKRAEAKKKTNDGSTNAEPVLQWRYNAADSIGATAKRGDTMIFLSGPNFDRFPCGPAPFLPF